MIRQGLIPSYNFGQRLTRLSRQYMDEHFKTKAGSRKRKKEALSFEPKDCYTIGEIAKKFHINDSSVFKHIRRHSIPTWKSHSTLPLLATQNYPFWLKYD